jgi:PHD/YefM family antitoxin component YafN of YafNO toxin-antitoxin module
MINNKELHVPIRKIHRKLVVDDQGMPTEVIIPWKEYREIEELLGLDLDANARDDLKKARQDREAGNKKAFVDIDSI